MCAPLHPEWAGATAPPTADAHTYATAPDPNTVATSDADASRADAITHTTIT